MIGKKSAIHLGGLLYALVFGSIFFVVALQIFPHAHPVLKGLVTGVFVISFYFVGMWVFVRQEQNKKIPTPSHELRRKKKEFYDWLDSQRRR